MTGGGKQKTAETSPEYQYSYPCSLLVLNIQSKKMAAKWYDQGVVRHLMDMYV